MSNPLTLSVMRYLRDLLSLPESQIKPGRVGEIRDDFTSPMIGVDIVGVLNRAGMETKYDPTAEQKTTTVSYSGAVSIDFYGAGAYDRATTYGRLHTSQAARNLRRSLGLNIQTPSPIVDPRQLAGQQYSERVQITQNATLYSEGVESALRIDSAQFQFTND